MTESVRNLREREYAKWSAGERDRYLRGKLKDLESLIASEAFQEFTPADRTTLIDGFVERCHKERLLSPTATSKPRRPKRKYRAPKPLAKATLPAAPAAPIPELSLQRAVFWAIAQWTTVVGIGLGVVCTLR